MSAAKSGPSEHRPPNQSLRLTVAAIPVLRGIGLCRQPRQLSLVVRPSAADRTRCPNIPGGKSGSDPSASHLRARIPVHSVAVAQRLATGVEAGIQSTKLRLRSRFCAPAQGGWSCRRFRPTARYSAAAKSCRMSEVTRGGIAGYR
jgi:hypothetical protein